MGMIAVREDHGAARRIILETEEWLEKEMQKDMGQILSTERAQGSYNNTTERQPNDAAAFSDNSKQMNFSTNRQEPSPNTLPQIVASAHQSQEVRSVASSIPGIPEQGLDSVRLQSLIT